ncbi:MAG: hypothetical protein ACJA1R_002740, partial [Flavobacteriales bacterium]
AGLVRDVEAFTGAGFESFTDLVAPRARAVALAGARAELIDAHTGAGFHQSARWRLDAPNGQRCEFGAGLHPYSGVYVTNVDVRIPNTLVEGRHDALAELLREWVRGTAPLSLHAHDADDNAIQNCESETMLRLGYGVEEALGPVAERPGREFNRGQFRYVANWVTFMGEEAVTLLEEAELCEWGESTEIFEGGRWARLSDEPTAFDTIRSGQRALVEQAGFDKLVARDRRVWGYWQRK